MSDDDDWTYHRVAHVDDLDEGQGRLVRADHKKLALFKIEGQLHCVQNTCPHAGGFLAHGEVRGRLVMCPRHSWGFDVVDGDCKSDPRYSVAVYPVRVEEGEVYVGLPADDGW